MRARLVVDIDKNQAALISAVNRVRASGQTLLLDGHFVCEERMGVQRYHQLMFLEDLQTVRFCYHCINADVVIERLQARGDTTYRFHIQIHGERGGACNYCF